MVTIVRVVYHVITFALASAMLILVLPIQLLASVRSDALPRGQSSSQRQPYDSISDSFPAPNPAEQNVFISRVLRWHVHYCGKNRMCKEFTASSCYRCAPCQCDLQCHNYGDCCPDVALEIQDGDFPRPFTGSDTNVVSCESAALKVPPTKGYRNNRVIPSQVGVDNSNVKPLKEHQEHSVQRYFMISRCPHSFSLDASHCESSDAVFPVISANNDSSDVYKNIHCARCHGVTDVISWNIQVSCEDRKNLSSLQSPRDVVSMTRLEPDCSVTYIPPVTKEARKCYTEKDMVFRCNVTGKWIKRDSFLERACHSYLTPKRVGNVLYKNVFCFLCNDGDDTTIELMLTSCQKSPEKSWTPSLVGTLLPFDVTRRNTYDSPLGDIPYERCNNYGIYDEIEETCREVTCAVSQQLTSGRCQPMFLTARGLGYELYFGLRPTAPIDLSGDHDLLHHLPAEMEVYLRKTLLGGNVKLQDFAMAFNTTDSDGRCSQVSNDLGVYARLISQTAMEQRQVQEELLMVRHSRFQIETRTWNMSFQGFPSETAWQVMHPARRLSPQTLTTCVIIVSNSHLEQKRDGTRRVGTTTPDPSTPSEIKEPPYVRMSSLISCPHVRLLPHEYSVSGPDGELKLEWVDSDLPHSRYIMDLEGNVTVCLSDFLRKLEGREKKSDLEHILAAVLLSISMLCLFMCFIVFLIFAVLRSLPGKNNMVLVVCLFFSQAALLVGFLVDEFSTLCAAMGLLTHYFTLCLFCSLIFCSYHVYAIFTTMHLSSSSTKERKVIALYCCFTFLLPLAIVGAVVIYYVSKRVTVDALGYGKGSICLVTSTIALWASLFAPLMATMVIVIILYCLTTSSLRHNKDVEINSTDERHVNFYFRVTLMTTVTWVIGVVAILLSLFSLRIAFIAMQCLLGLYVFVSLVLTPRVTRLLSGACCQSRHQPRGRTSLHMKMASSKDCPVQPPCIVGTGYRKRDPQPTGGGIVELPGNRYKKRSEFLESAA